MTTYCIRCNEPQVEGCPLCRRDYYKIDPCDCNLEELSFEERWMEEENDTT